MAEDLPEFDDLVDLLRERLAAADALKPAAIHSFKELMADKADAIAENWYWDAFEELEVQGRLDPASHTADLGDACGRLSGDGRLNVRSSG